MSFPARRSGPNGRLILFRILEILSNIKVLIIKEFLIIKTDSDQSTKVLRASRRPSVCLAIPALTASLGSVKDTLTL